MEPYDIGAAFAAIEDDLIDSIIRNMRRHRVEEVSEQKQWAMWQAKQLDSLERSKKRNRKKYEGTFESINNSIDRVLEKAYQEGGMEEEIEILKQIKRRYGDTVTGRIGRAGRRVAAKLPFGKKMDKDFFDVHDDRLDALIHSTKHDMQKAEHAMLRMADDQYRKIIFNAQAYAISGAGTYEKAVDMATKDFLSAGINCIQYKDGRRVNIKSYASMAVRTAEKRATLYAEGKARQSLGITTVISKKRSNACPKCLPFVNKVMIDDVWSGGSRKDGPYPLVSEAIAAGFLHPNCKDHISTYIEGVTDPPEKGFTQSEIKEIAQVSGREAKQQHAERQEERFGRLARYSLDLGNQEMYSRKEKEWRHVRFKTGGMTPKEYAESKRPLADFHAVPEDCVVNVMRKDSEMWIKSLTPVMK